VGWTRGKEDEGEEEEGGGREGGGMDGTRRTQSENELRQLCAFLFTREQIHEMARLRLISAGGAPRRAAPLPAGALIALKSRSLGCLLKVPGQGLTKPLVPSAPQQLDRNVKRFGRDRGDVRGSRTPPDPLLPPSPPPLLARRCRRWQSLHLGVPLDRGPNGKSKLRGVVSLSRGAACRAPNERQGQTSGAAACLALAAGAATQLTPLLLSSPPCPRARTRNPTRLDMRNEGKNGACKTRRSAWGAVWSAALRRCLKLDEVRGAGWADRIKNWAREKLGEALVVRRQLDGLGCSPSRCMPLSERACG